jgi:hypothetical protein
MSLGQPTHQYIEKVALRTCPLDVLARQQPQKHLLGRLLRNMRRFVHRWREEFSRH